MPVGPEAGDFNCLQHELFDRRSILLPHVAPIFSVLHRVCLREASGQWLLLIIINIAATRFELWICFKSMRTSHDAGTAMLRGWA